MIMFGLCYAIRLWDFLPMGKEFSLKYLDLWVTEVLSIIPFLLVLDILRSTFRVYRSSYQEDLDVLKVKHLLPACVILAVAIHPNMVGGLRFSINWTVGFYIDFAALMPQVVLMARSGGTVEAPIAHFVAGTTFSRLLDLWFWYVDIGPQGQITAFNSSAFLVVVVHVLNLLLVADFMYYYMKARISGSKFSA